MASSGLSDPPTSPGGPFELYQPPANTSTGNSAAAEVEEEAQEEDIDDEDDEEDDEEMGDADEEEGYDDEPVYPEDIVPETRKLWKKLRDAATKRYHRGHRSQSHPLGGDIGFGPENALFSMPRTKRQVNQTRSRCFFEQQVIFWCLLEGEGEPRKVSRLLVLTSARPTTHLGKEIIISLESPH